MAEVASTPTSTSTNITFSCPNVRVMDRLTDHNYATCSMSFELLLASQGKSVLTIGPPSKIDATKYDQWACEDSIVRFWMVNSVSPSVLSRIRTTTSAKKKWSILKSQYSTKASTSQIYELYM